jgi:hypothetical protein
MVMKLDRPNLIPCSLNQIRTFVKNHFHIEVLHVAWNKLQTNLKSLDSYTTLERNLVPNQPRSQGFSLFVIGKAGKGPGTGRSSMYSDWSMTSTLLCKYCNLGLIYSNFGIS